MANSKTEGKRSYTALLGLKGATRALGHHRRSKPAATATASFQLPVLPARSTQHHQAPSTFQAPSNNSNSSKANAKRATHERARWRWRRGMGTWTRGLLYLLATSYKSCFGFEISKRRVPPPLLLLACCSATLLGPYSHAVAAVTATVVAYI
jgi:hypothetical protein